MDLLPRGQIRLFAGRGGACGVGCRTRGRSSTPPPGAGTVNRFLSSATVLLVLVAPPLNAADAPLRVGFGEVDVTPKLDKKRPVYLAGFGQDRKATAVHDPIMAR